MYRDNNNNNNIGVKIRKRTSRVRKSKEKYSQAAGDESRGLAGVQVCERARDKRIGACQMVLGGYGLVGIQVRSEYTRKNIFIFIKHNNKQS